MAFAPNMGQLFSEAGVVTEGGEGSGGAVVDPVTFTWDSVAGGKAVSFESGVVSDVSSASSSILSHPVAKMISTNANDIMNRIADFFIPLPPDSILHTLND